MLAIENSRDVLKRLNPAGVDSIYTSTASGTRSITFISQGNLYRLVAQSRKPEAEAFERNVLARLNTKGVDSIYTLTPGGEQLTTRMMR